MSRFATLIWIWKRLRKKCVSRKGRERAPRRLWNNRAIDLYPELPTTLKSFKRKMYWQSPTTPTLPVFTATTLQKYLWPERSASRNQALLNTWRYNNHGRPKSGNEYTARTKRASGPA